MKQIISKDKQKAESLIKTAETTLIRLNETEKTKYPSNSLIDYYSILHSLMEALTYKEGLKFRGESAHKELINYICQKYNLEESIRVFIQELRSYRNNISYEGFSVKKEFIEQNIV